LTSRSSRTCVPDGGGRGTHAPAALAGDGRADRDHAPSFCQRRAAAEALPEIDLILGGHEHDNVAAAAGLQPLS
jgi:hypothetical protein